MRIVFFGSGAFGLPTLRMLHERHDLVRIVTQPDRRAGRGRQLTPSPVGAFADTHRLPTLKPERINEPEIVHAIRDLDADAFVVIAYGQKLGPELLADQFAINLHSSLLPRHRGAAPIHWAILSGDEITGVSVITLAPTMDAGDVLGHRTITISPEETAGELHDRLAELGPELVLDVLNGHATGTLTPAPQDESLATHARKLSRADATVDFALDAAEVRARVHGLTPWPGCRVEVGDRSLTLCRVRVVDPEGDHGAPGTHREDGSIACGRGLILPLEVHPPGKSVMEYAAYLRGRPIEPGTRWRAITAEPASADGGGGHP